MDFEKSTKEVNANEISDNLKKYKKEKGNIGLHNIENIGLAQDNLTQMISSAYFYEKKYLRNIINFLRTAGWDTGKFLSGTTKKRGGNDQVSVEWETDGRPD